MTHKHKITPIFHTPSTDRLERMQCYDGDRSCTGLYWESSMVYSSSLVSDVCSVTQHSRTMARFDWKLLRKDCVMSLLLSGSLLIYVLSTGFWELVIWNHHLHCSCLHCDAEGKCRPDYFILTRVIRTGVTWAVWKGMFLFQCSDGADYNVVLMSSVSF